MLGLNLTAQIKVYTYNTYYNILLLLLTRFVCYSPKKTGFASHEVWTTFGLVVCFLIFLIMEQSSSLTRLTVTKKHPTSGCSEQSKTLGFNTIHEVPAELREDSHNQRLPSSASS